MFSICFCFGPLLIRSTISLILRKYAETTWKVGVHQSYSDFRLPLFCIELSAMTVRVLLRHMHQLMDARVAGCHRHVCSVCCNALEAILCAGLGGGCFPTLSVQGSSDTLGLTGMQELSSRDHTHVLVLSGTAADFCHTDPGILINSVSCDFCPKRRQRIVCL